MGGLTRTASFASAQMEKAIAQRAGRVASLRQQRRTLRKKLAALDHDIKTETRCLRALIRDLKEAN
jgi:septal ring factor EnvC (AmiA/AmiB activator)